MRKLIRLVPMALFLIEIFIFKAKHFASATIIAGDFLGKYFTNAIIGR